MEKEVRPAIRYRVEDLILDSGTFQVSRADRRIKLPRLSFQLLLALIRASPNVLSHDELVEQVWAGRFVSYETVTQRIKLLRQALDDSAIEPRYIGVIRGEGYRLLADVELLPTADGFLPATAGKRNRAKIKIGIVLFFVASAILAVMLNISSRRDASEQEAAKIAARHSVVVLPFINASENPADLYISEGLSDELRDQLGRVSGLRIAARSSSTAFRNDPTDALEISDRLGVGILVEGNFRHEGDQIKISVHIIDGTTGFQSWSRIYDFAIGDVLAVQQKIADDLVQQLLPQRDQDTVASEPASRNLSAHDLILLARYYEQQVRNQPIVDQALLLKAIDLYRQAIAVDPLSAMAQSRLGAALLYLGDVEGAQEPIFESLKLNPNLSDVQYTLGLYYWKRQQPGSGAAYERAIQLSPNNADALTAYAMWRWHQGDARTPEQYFLQALALDPMLPSRYLDLGNFYGSAGRRDEAMQILQDMRAHFDDRKTALMQARIYELVGEFDLAIAWALRARELQPDNPEPLWMVAELYARIGDFTKAKEYEPEPGPGQLYWQRRYDELIDMAEELQFEPFSEINTLYVLARAYSADHQFAQAISLLQRTGLPDTVYSDSRRADGVEAMVLLADAHDALGDTDKAKEYSEWLQPFFNKFIENGYEKSWWPNVYQACVLAILQRDDESMEQLGHIDDDPGLVWYPVLMDSHCFERFADDPRYQTVVNHINQRMTDIRQRVPVTLAHFNSAIGSGKP